MHFPQTKIIPWNDFRNYRLTQSVSIVENGKRQNSKISFQYNLACLELLNENVFYLKMERENFKINDQNPETPHMQMFVGAENSLYPVSIEISNESDFMAIHNFHEWKTGTFKKLNELTSQFEGYYSEDFIQRFQDEIQTNSSAKQKLLGQNPISFLIFTPFSSENQNKLNWNFLKIGQHKFSPNFKETRISDNLIKLEFNQNEKLSIGKNGEEFHSEIEFSHQFHPQTNITRTKDCTVKLHSDTGNFTYLENIKMEFMGVKVNTEHEKTESKSKKKHFFLEEKEI